LWNKPFVKRIKYSLGIGVMLVLLAGCHRHGSESGAIVYTPDQFAAPEATEPPIRIAVTAAFISEAGVGVYEKLARYLEVRTGYPCKLVSGFSYRTVDKMLAAGAIEVACVCGLPYVLSQELPNPPTRLMAVPIPANPRYRGRPVYYSDIIVRADSPYRRIEDLKGRVWAYNDELSNSGYNLPRAFLIRKGLHKGFLGKVIRTGSHEESIRAVATGEADVSAVDSLVLDYERWRGSEYARKVRVIHSLGPSGIVPVVASRKMSPERFRAVQRALLEMHTTPEGKAILREAGLLRFTSAEDTLYNDIRDALNTARRASCMGLQL
jgi:phosphonate transport system substrate-binding protein